MKKCNAKMYIPSDAQSAELDNITGTNNIVLISYSVLTENKKYHFTTPTLCRGCGAALCTYSVLYKKDAYYNKMEQEEASKQLADEQKVQQNAKDKESAFLKGKFFKDLREDELGWICEFCGVHNRLPIDTRPPETQDELYLVKKAAITESQTQKEEEKKEEEKERDVEVNTEDDTRLIFCIDVSGSMGEHHQVIQDGKSFQASRMKLVVDSVVAQIDQMKLTYPNRKVGLVTFDSNIILYGDCTQPNVKVNGNNDKPQGFFNALKNSKQNLTDFEGLLTLSKKHNVSLLKKPIKESVHKLRATIEKLQPGSSTALGPGLLCSLGLVQGKPGSRIILCTDGLANVGLGSLGNGEVSKESKAFYDRVGDIAVESGVSISIITIQGNSCRVDALGPLTDRTAGTILRVDPANMDLTEMTSNNIIATNVRLKVIMHEGLSFENESASSLQNNGSILMKNVGSVSQSNEAYFEYRVKPLPKLQEAGVDIEEVKFIPLQSQITYTDLKGNEFVRVISNQQELTKNQAEAEKEVQASILTGYIEKETANLALQGKTKEAKKKNAAWMGFMQKVANNAEAEEDQKVFQNFQVQNMQLQELIEQTEAPTNMNIAQKDEVASKLYKFKQQKKK